MFILLNCHLLHTSGFKLTLKISRNQIKLKYTVLHFNSFSYFIIANKNPFKHDVIQIESSLSILTTTYDKPSKHKYMAL